jgi:hypothetical protein
MPQNRLALWAFVTFAVRLIVWIFHHSAFDISLFCFAASKHLAAAVLLHRRMASFQFNAQPRIR